MDKFCLTMNVNRRLRQKLGTPSLYTGTGMCGAIYGCNSLLVHLAVQLHCYKLYNPGQGQFFRLRATATLAKWRTVHWTIAIRNSLYAQVTYKHKVCSLAWNDQM